MDLTEWRAVVRREVVANRGYPKSVVVLVALRTAQLVRGRPGMAGRLGYVVVGGAYKLLSEWLLGVEIPASTQIGAGLRLRHGVGVVINPHVVIGEDVMIRHGVTLGNRHAEDDCPRIGDGVEFGAGAAVIGDISVGAGAKVGAGAVVVEDVPPGGVAYTPTVVRPPRSPTD